VPALDVGKYWHAIRPVLWDFLPHGGDPFRLCLMWLACCMLIEATVGVARTTRLFPMFAGTIFLARVLIADTVLSSADIAGACVAYALWLLLFRRAPARNAILAAFFAAMLVAMRLPLPHGIAWLPIVERVFLFGALIWLLTQAGLRLTLSTLATALLLLIIQLGETHFQMRPAALTNAGIAIGVGALFYVAGLRLFRRSRP
jgi:hypothetical protein